LDSLLPATSPSHALVQLAVLGLIGMVVYGGMVGLMLGKRWLRAFARSGGAAPSPVVAAK
jgi:hypothetical protein